MFNWLKEKALGLFEKAKVRFGKATKFIGTMANEISKKVVGADFITVAKFGVAAGCTIGAIILIYKIIKAKIDSVKNSDNTENMNAAEKAMHGKNFRDAREQQNLHRKMNRVSEVLRKDARRYQAGAKYFWLKKFLYEEENPGKVMGCKADWEEFFDDAWFKFGMRDVDDDFAFMKLDEFFDACEDFDTIDGFKEEGDDHLMRKTWENANLSHHADIM